MGSNKQHHFVLVHGAGHGAWCWIKVIAILEKAGHQVTAVDLASAGENDEIADDITCLEQYSRPLENLFKSFPDDKKVILVGHSLGGMSVAWMSELFPKNISVGVYMAASMPAPGLDFNKFRASDPELIPRTEGIPIILHSQVEGGPITSNEFPVERLRTTFYNKCSIEDFSFAAERMKRFPLLRPIFVPFPGTEEKYGSVPRVFVLATQDKIFSPSRVRRMIALYPPAEVREIDGDHSFFFSAVEGAVKVLSEVAAKYDS